MATPRGGRCISSALVSFSVAAISARRRISEMEKIAFKISSIGPGTLSHTTDTLGTYDLI